MFLTWLGEQITERGIGNGISLIIFAGIVAGLPPAIGSTIEQFKQEGGAYVLVLIAIIAIVVAVTVFVVFMERALRKITVHYARQQQGNRMYAPPTSHLPLKINQSGVIPAIFASSIIMFPATVASWFGQGDSTFAQIVNKVSQVLQPGQPLYELLYASAIVFFCFFYTSLVFNPKELSENLKKSGAFISGIRPGEQTAKFIDQVMTRLTLVGSMYMVLVCLIPQFMMTFLNVQFYFGGTSLLIVVVVVMDFTSQLMAHKVSHQYADVMRKQNLKFTNRI
jgi:preprotein translocase subunit SecY